MSTPQDRTRLHRRLPVLVTELAIGDGEAALPVVGEIGRYWLLFAETSPDERDPSIVTVEVDVEPLDDGVPLRQPAPSAALPENERWWEWRLFVRGDRWSATWYSRRPAVGRQRLTGRLLGDLGYATTGSARGRILRARVVSDTYRLLEQPATGPKRHPRWMPVPGTRTLRDVDAATGVFRDDTRPAMHRAEGEDVIRECGVLVDLDLDDVPALPVRPNIVPAAVSAHGRDAWVVDRELPVVIRMSEDQRIVEYRLPGRVFASPAHRPRWLHADAAGCWVVGRDGIFRCGLDGTGIRIDDGPVGGSAACDGVLLSWHRSGEHTALTVRWPDGRHEDLEPVHGRVGPVGTRAGGFVAVVNTETGGEHSQLLEVGLDASTRLGPRLAPLTGKVLVGDDPFRVVDVRGRQVPIRPDLTVGEVEDVPIRGSAGGTAGPWMWIVHPASSVEGIVPDEPGHWHCLLSILDPVTFSVLCRLEICSPYPDVSYDGAGRVWVVAGGMWSVDPRSPDSVQRVHLDAPAPG